MIEGLKPYPAYRDSGVPWLGKIPDHWQVRRLKQVCRLAYGDSLPSDERQPGDVPVLGSNGRVGYHASANTRGPCVVIGRKGSFGKVNFSLDPVFAIDTTFFVDERHTEANLRWLSYLLGWLGLDRVSKDSAIPGLDRQDAYLTQVPLPTDRREQEAISHFLDHADRRIRRYIRAKQKLIKLLEEQKRAVVYHAVTRGLNFNAPLKPSGMEWLRDIPEHWEVRRLKSLVRRIDQGVSPQAENYLAESGAWGVLKAGCVNRGVFRQCEHKRLPAEFKVNPKLAVMEGDVLVSRASGSPRLVGSAGRVTSLQYKLILSDKTFRLVFVQDVDPDFMVLAMNNRYYRWQVEQAISGAEGLASNLPSSSLRAFAFAIPPIQEQRQIVEDVLRSTKELSVATVRAAREIELLSEYRTRLITDIVTGKLDVREAAAQLSDEADESEPLDETVALVEAENADDALEIDAVAEEVEA